MIISKLLKYPCFSICNVDVQIIDWICIWLKLIFWWKPNVHRDKTWNRTPYKTTNNTTPYSDDEITKRHNKNLICVKIIYLNWKKGEKRCKWVILSKKGSRTIPPRWMKENKTLRDIFDIFITCKVVYYISSILLIATIIFVRLYFRHSLDTLFVFYLYISITSSIYKVYYTIHFFFFLSRCKHS